MSSLEKRVGDITLGTWLDGWPRWTSLKIRDKEIKSLQPKDLRDLRYAIDRFLAQIEDHDARLP